MATCFLLLAPLAAHHSWTADYDSAKPVTVKGVVTKVEWTNPHTLYIESKDEKGTVTSWNFEMASTLALERGGWSRNARGRDRSDDFRFRRQGGDGTRDRELDCHGRRSIAVRRKTRQLRFVICDW